MDAATLKAKTLHTWREFHKLHECVIPGEEAFLAEVRQYGELDQPQTWQHAWASLYAKFMADTPVLDEPTFFVEFYLIQSAQKEDWADLMPLMLEKIAEIPATLNALLEGIADIRNHGNGNGQPTPGAIAQATPAMPPAVPPSQEPESADVQEWVALFEEIKAALPNASETTWRAAANNLFSIRCRIRDEFAKDF